VGTRVLKTRQWFKIQTSGPTPSNTFLFSSLATVISIEWSLILVFFTNIGQVLWGYARKNNNFEYLPLTPSQRALLGLEPGMWLVVDKRNLASFHMR